MVLGLIDGDDERKENNRVVLKHSGERNEMEKEMVGENESRPAKRTGGEGSEGASDKDQERGADENDGRREKCEGTIEERTNKLSVDEWMKKKQSPLHQACGRRGRHGCCGEEMANHHQEGDG